MNALQKEDLRYSYQADGYFSPLPALSLEAANDARSIIELFEKKQGAKLEKKYRHKPHMLMPLLNDIVHSDAVLNYVETIIGPNILCWESVLFIKEPGDKAFVSWHQDVTYWGLEPFEIVTAWIALSVSDKTSGCMRMLPGSHKGDVSPHVDTFAPNNMLSRGQEVAVAVDEARSVDIILNPGEMSLHDVKIVHGSDPNESNDRRMGFAIRYIPTHVKQVAGKDDSAMIVRGVDRHHFFTTDPSPKENFSNDALSAHDFAHQNRMKILMRHSK